MFKLTTDRLVIRRFNETDLDDVRQLMTSSKVMRFTGFRVPQPEEKIRACLTKWINENEKGLGVWAAESKRDGHFIGWVMLKLTGSKFPELGFMISESHWGNGYASEMAAKVLEYGLQQLKLSKVVAVVNSKNKPSIRILEKLGMKLETTENHQNDTILRYEFHPR